MSIPKLLLRRVLLSVWLDSSRACLVAENVAMHTRGVAPPDAQRLPLRPSVLVMATREF